MCYQYYPHLSKNDQCSTRQKLTAVFNATKQHAKNLAKYVTIYKTALLVLRNLHSGNSRPIDSFLSGLLGGYVVFGENNNINQQIVLYVFARVAMGSAKVLASGKFSDGPFDQLIGSQRMKDIAWPLFASLCWGAVMYLHSEHVQAIQPSLASSMNYLYNDSNNWNSFRKLTPLIRVLSNMSGNFFWHNI